MANLLKLYYITDTYIDYLRKFDKNIYYNKNHTRPYIGVVYTFNNRNYFVPLSSPKEKHLKMNPKQIDIYKIKNGELGIININNMIPVPIEELTEALSVTKDKKYKKLLTEQITFINNDRRRLLKKVDNFQKMYWKGYLDTNVLMRTCNFTLLQEKCDEWINEKTCKK